MPAPVHDWSGFLPLVRVGGLEIQTYFLIISLTLISSVIWLTRRAVSYKQKKNDALDIALVAMVAGFLGSRLLHVFFEEPRYYWHDPIQVLHIERGGFVWFGGLIAGAGASLAWVHFKRLDRNAWFDVFAPLLAFGYAMGRVACFLTGCCYGRVCALPSGYIFRYPTQAFAVAWELAALALLLVWEKKRPRGTANGKLFWQWLCLHSIGRIIMESFRDDDRGPMLGPLSVSTFLSLIFLALAILQLKRRKMTGLSRK